MLKKNNGITLIALVITIIVLLILAGVSIAMLTGNNGILTNSNKAKAENAAAQAEEQMKLAYMAVRTEIMAQTVDNSSYDPASNTVPSGATESNLQQLKAIVEEDLGTGSGYSVTISEASGTGDTATPAKINIKYTNSAISTITGVKYNGHVNGTITIKDQSAEFEFDTAD